MVTSRLFGLRRVNSVNCAPQVGQKLRVQLVDEAVRRLALSPRGIHRIQRVARTIADLADCAEIEPPHIAEAVAVRLGALA